MSTSSLELLRIGLLVAIVIAAGMLGVRAGLPQPESRFDTLFALVASTLMSGVCVVDSRILKRPIVFIAQAALFFLWPIAVPIYLIWARGWWGVLVLGVGTAILFGTIAISGVVTVIVTGRG